MQKLAEICIRRPVFAAMIVLSLVVVGAASYFRLGVDRFPSVDLPTVSVRTVLPGASAEEVETLVSQPIEEAVNTVEGIDELRSVSGPGISFVIATFKLDRNLETAAQDVRDRVSTVINRLPEEARERPPVVQKFNNDSAPVITIALTGERSLRELTELGDKVIFGLSQNLLSGHTVKHLLSALGCLAILLMLQKRKLLPFEETKVSNL